ncbi:forkhead box protein R1 [Cololabis saira]|uniref:forkhead box protein R1 n=1 Tax=Cololabis saira TaxID=129043 RepID=UPI002AD33259|nr:forkhead box protein R1 [Cololabis saira]
MTFQLKTRAHFFDLHGSFGLKDWDMDKELKLAKTTDQFDHDNKLSDQYVAQTPITRASRGKGELIWYAKPSDTVIRPNLWLLVNPNIVCPMPYVDAAADLQPTCEPAEDIQMHLQESAEAQRPAPAEVHRFRPQEKWLHSVPTSSAYTVHEDVTSQPARNRRKGRTTKVMETTTLKPGCWPRPPVNYCILISLALKGTLVGGLKVQQIYNFVREHFPFFQTAPDGWKNTIRHNLCFNSSFRKTFNQLCRDGKRKSCFWHLTPDGHRRLKDELQMLVGEALKQLQRSMSHPGG